MTDSPLITIQPELDSLSLSLKDANGETLPHCGLTVVRVHDLSTVLAAVHILAGTLAQLAEQARQS